ncbi:sensor domain-containing protein [Sporosarcina ureilytica]|uniref:PAS domain S-box protein n=1 Tax=Sporosarcina ureilytica TaxID=298596 RepID=A0A1D8JCN9_9BACL|nr:EAL domain-containing protein [Sporosarcina ureilytica]AOV06471.1 PAS domain S-box protein [Sporosarcina ureilytica]
MLTTIKNTSSIPLLLEEKLCISIFDCNGIILHVNHLFCQLAMYEEYELIGKHYSLLTSTEAFDQFISDITVAIKEKNIAQRKVKRIAKDGTAYWVQATIVPVLNENGVIEKFISFDIDVTNQVLAEKKYAETLKDLHNIENALDQSTVVVITDQRGVITYVNEKFCRLSQYSSNELIGQTHRIINSGYHQKSFFKDMWRTIGNGKIWKGDIKNRAKDGTEYWVNTTIVPFLNEKNIPYQYIAIRTDITARKEAEQSLKIALRNDFQQTVKNLQNGIFKYTDDGQGGIAITLLEGRLVERLNLSLSDIVKNNIPHPFSQKELMDYKSLLRRTLQGEINHFEISYFNYTFLIYLSPIFENGVVTEVVGTIIDITERKEAEKQIERMAYYDFLTKLPNRRLFEKEVEINIENAKRNNESFAIMFIDLDRFKHINDSMGHAIGDELLKGVSHRLTRLIRENDIVCRQGGDEFVILLSRTDSHEAESIAKRLLDDLSEPFTFQEFDMFVNASIGISLYPKDGVTFEQLMSNADTAMFQAKEKQTNTYQFYTEELHREIMEKSILGTDLRRALKENQFELHYQPQVDLKTGTITGVEALIRWKHPTQGLISPARFIPIAEETGSIVAIGKWVLETACAQAKQWQIAGFPPVQINVNVSTQQFKQLTFVDQVKETLIKTGLHPGYLNLEITESMTSDVQHCKIMLSELRDLGVNVSIDDFGTGYSSLSYLSEYPITHLKIDQVFVQELNQSNRAIVKTIINLASNLNLQVVAEGVETKEQLDFLKTLDCDKVQGYFYSKPLPHEQIEPLLLQNF